MHIMKKTLLALSIILSFSGFSQSTVWNQLPAVPAGPSAGSTAAEAGDVIITDDGTIYTSYMWDDGSGMQLFIAFYDAPNGSWENIHSEYVYNGFQMIRSRKHASDAYFVAITNPGSGTPILKVFKATAQTANELCYIYLNDYYPGAPIDFEMSTNPAYGYLFYKNAAGNNVNLGRIDYANSSLTSQLSAVAGITTIHTYDMTTIGDSVFMMMSIEAPTHKLLLHKSGPGATTIVPYSASAPANGEILNAGNSISTYDCMINSDHTSKVFLQGYDFGNMQGIEKTYSNGAISSTTWYGNLAEQYSAGATVAEPNKAFYLNNYSPSNSAPYKTYVMTHDPATAVRDTIGSPNNYVLSNNAPTQHRMGYCTPQNRLAVSFWETAIGERRYYLSNDLPYADPGDQVSYYAMCQNQSSSLFDVLSLTDDNGDYVSIIGFESSDNSILDPANIAWSYISMSGHQTNWYVYGTASAPGTVTVTVEVTDYYDTVQIVLPAITVQAENPPVWTAASYTICSNQGDLNLFDFVSQTGGNFFDGSNEIDFNNGIFPTNSSPYANGQSEILSYNLTAGACYYELDVPVTFYESPTVSIAQTATVCGQSTGSATALVSGGGTPYAFSQWSSGQQNTNNASGLGAGQHSYTVIDAHGCQVNNYFEIPVTGASVNGTVTNVSCHGEDDGAIAIATTGLTSPIIALWSSGHSTINLSGVVAGNYTVNLTDAAGCSLSKTFAITQPEPLITGAGINTLPDCGASNGVLEAYFSTGGTGAYTYNWSNGDVGTIADNVEYGIYSLTTTDDNNCTYVNTFYVSEAGAPFLAGSVTGTDCGGATGAIDVTPQLNVGVTVTSVEWSNSATTEDIANLAPALYVCELHTSDDCSAIKAWTVPSPVPERQEICVVTVDSATTTNLVVWEKVQTTGVHHYNIYRETSIQGAYALIDTVEATNLSVFNDVVASPLARAWRYKIAAVNACGQEGPVSGVHQTIHLDVLENSSNTADISWNAYEGAAFSEYIVSRYTDATGLWEVIATVPNTQLSYTDDEPFATPGLDYMVEMELDQMCTATIWRAQDFNSSRSNKEKGQFAPGNGTGDSNNSLSELVNNGTVEVFPNPFTDKLTIRVADVTEAVEVNVFGISGELQQSGTFDNGTNLLDLSELAPGVYLIQLGNAGHVKRMVKM